MDFLTVQANGMELIECYWVIVCCLLLLLNHAHLLWLFRFLDMTSPHLTTLTEALKGALLGSQHPDFYSLGIPSALLCSSSTAQPSSGAGAVLPGSSQHHSTFVAQTTAQKITPGQPMQGPFFLLFFLLDFNFVLSMIFVNIIYY